MKEKEDQQQQSGASSQKTVKVEAESVSTTTTVTTATTAVIGQKNADESPNKSNREEKESSMEADTKPPLIAGSKESDCSSIGTGAYTSPQKKSPRKMVYYDQKYPPDDGLLPPSDEPIETPEPEDILFGRGGLTNHHKGIVHPSYSFIWSSFLLSYRCSSTVNLYILLYQGTLCVFSRNRGSRASGHNRANHDI